MQITGGTNTYSTVTSDDDIFVYVGTGSILLRNAAGLSAVNISGGRREFREENTVVTLTEDPDTYNNTVESMTIAALGGADSITNSGANVSIDGGADDDEINTAGNNVTVEVGDGYDSIFNDGNSASLGGGDGKDFIANSGANVSMDGGKGDDFISLSNDSENNLIIYNEGDGNDTISGFKNTDVLRIFNQKFTRSTVGNDVVVKVGNSPGSVTLLDGATLTPPYINIRDTLASNLITLLESNNQFSNDIDDATIVALDGDDTVENHGVNISVSGGGGDDSIVNYNDGASVTIDAGAGKDTVRNYGSNVTIDGGDGNDYVENEVETSNVIINSGNGNDIIISGGSNLTINAGNGNDSIGLSKSARNNVIQYNLGDGDDTLWGYSTNTTLNISEEDVTSVASGDNMIIYVGDGSITLIDAREKLPHIVLGAGGTSGGGSGSGGSGGGASGGGSSSGSGGSGGSSGGSGGSSGSSGNGNDKSSSIGTVGRRIRTAASTGNTETTNQAVVQNQYIDYTMAARQALTAVEYPTFTRSAVTSTSEVTIPNLDFSPMTTQQVINQRVYSGGNQIISDYQSGQKIIFNDVYTGSFYDAEGNYCVGSSTGALVIQNATGKVIDLSDAAGNSFLKAYAASTAGVIDGRGLSGFEIINGSNGADAIFAGDGGSQLWGGADVAADALIGGGGTDIFIGGRTQDADVFSNASSADIVNLNDATLSDIVATAENNGSIAIAFNTGNVIGVQSSELLSAAVILADGLAYRYNHATRNWQTA